MASQVSPPPSTTSSLNPHAALFVPSSAPHAFSVDDDDDSFAPEVIMPEWDVEDFSPQWWTLVQTSPEFREFWLYGYEANVAGADSEDLLFVMQCEEVIDDDAAVNNDTTVDDNSTVHNHSDAN